MYMFDTNTLIYFIKNKPASVAARVNGLDANTELCMSFFTFAELLKGAQRSTKKSEVIERLNQLIRHIQVEYAVDRLLCEHYATQFSRLREAGTPIGANDLWIAAHALALNCTLVTNNVSEFARVQGLPLENWVDAQ